MLAISHEMNVYLSASGYAVQHRWGDSRWENVGRQFGTHAEAAEFVERMRREDTINLRNELRRTA
jgi:hypothetical protein